MSDANGLRGIWGLGDAQIPAAASGQQATQFRDAFLKSITAANESLKFTSTNADQAAHLQLAGQREALYAAYQAVSAKIDPNDPSKAQPSIERVLANVNSLQSKAAALKQETESGLTAWQAREAEFDKANDQILAMSDGGHEKASSFRTAYDAIFAKSKERKYREAMSALDPFLSKLAAAHAEFLKQKEAPSVSGEAKTAAAQATPEPLAATTSPAAQNAPDQKSGGVWDSVTGTAASAWEGVSWAGNEIYSGMKFNAGLIQQGEHALSGKIDSLQDTAAAKVQGWADMTDGIPVLEQAADVASWGFDMNTQVIAGVYEGAVGLGAGVLTMAANPIDTAKGLAAMAEHTPIVPFAPNPFKMAKGAYDVVFGDAKLSETADRVFNPATAQKEDAEFWKKAVTGFLEPYGRTIGEDKDYMKAVGRAGFDIAGFFIGAGEVNAVAKGSQAAKVAAAAKMADTTADAARLAEAGKVGQVAKPLEAATTARAAGTTKAAETAKVVGGTKTAGSATGDIARATGTDGKAMASVGDDAGRSAGAADNAGGGSGKGPGGDPGGGGSGGGGGGGSGGGGGGKGGGGPVGPTPPRPPFPVPPAVLEQPGVLEKLRSLITRKKPAPTGEMKIGVDAAAEAVPKGFKDPAGVWDQTMLNSGTDKAKRLLDSLEEFDAGTRGKSVKELDLRGKSPQQIHEELLDNGFSFNPDPEFNVISIKDASGTTKYKTLDGNWTTDLKDPAGLAPQYIYTHPDGGMVRVKPYGDPGSFVRPEPHVNKCVLDGKGTGWDNELFKVTNDGKNGQPMPKAPNAESGLPPSRVPKGKDDPLKGSPQDLEANGYANKVMDEAHADLPMPSIFDDPPPKLP